MQSISDIFLKVQCFPVRTFQLQLVINFRKIFFQAKKLQTTFSNHSACITSRRKRRTNENFFGKLLTKLLHFVHNSRNDSSGEKAISTNK